LEKILTAIDFSEVTEAVLEKTVELVKAFDARLCILHAEPDGDQYAREEDNEDFEAEIGHKIDIIRKSLNEKSIFPYIREVSGTAAKCILNECDRFYPDLIILGSHRQNKFLRLFGDKVREEVLLKAPCSVLIVHPDDIKKSVN